MDAIGLLADTDLDRVLDLDGFNADEEAILRKSYWLIRENWDLAEWAVCQTASNGLASAVQVARLFQIVFPRRDDPVRIRGVGRGGNGVFGGCDTGLLVPWVMSAWIPALANAAQLMESIHTPGTQVASASEGQWHILVCLAPGGSFMRFVNNWSAGGVAVRLCMNSTSQQSSYMSSPTLRSSLVRTSLPQVAHAHRSSRICSAGRCSNATNKCG